MHLRTVATALICTIVLSTLAFAGPKSKIVENTFDFGYVPQSAEISHKFWVKSVGDEMLSITKVIPGCGCTKVPLEKDQIAPGDSTWMEIIFSTKKYNGIMAKHPQFLTNESTYKQRLNFSALVYAEPGTDMPLVLEPPLVSLTGFIPEKEKAEVVITNKLDTDVSISLIDSDNAFTEVSLPKEIKAGASAKVYIALQNGADKKTFSKSLTFELHDADKTRYTIPISYVTSGMQMTNSK